MENKSPGFGGSSLTSDTKTSRRFNIFDNKKQKSIFKKDTEPDKNHNMLIG